MLLHELNIRIYRRVLDVTMNSIFLKYAYLILTDICMALYFRNYVSLNSFLFLRMYMKQGRDLDLITFNWLKHKIIILLLTV
jgi:hypothetical protein